MKHRRNENSQPVYSTEGGKVDRPKQKKQKSSGSNIPTFKDDIIRVRREVKGRRGKPVTLIMNLAMSAAEIVDLATELKRRCGTGGSVKDGVILVQGDRVDDIISVLQEKGFKVKKAGG